MLGKDLEGESSEDLCRSDEHTAAELANHTFLVKLTQRVRRAQDASVFADRIEQSAEGIKAFPNRIVLDDF